MLAPASARMSATAAMMPTRSWPSTVTMMRVDFVCIRLLSPKRVGRRRAFQDMKFQAISWVLLLGITRAFAQVPDTAGDWRVTLIKPKDCIPCTIVEEGLKRKGYLQRVVLSDGPDAAVTAAIERRSGTELTPEEWQELRALPYFDRPLWEQQAEDRSAQVLLKRDGHIVAAGNIADSADLRGVHFPEDLTLPAPGATLPALRNAYGNYFQQLYLERWNLDWFFRLARHPAMAEERRLERWLQEQKLNVAAPLESANVVLASTGAGAIDNPIFNAIRSEEIEHTLQSDAGVAPEQIQVFYGSGTRLGANAIEQGSSGGMRFIHRELRGARPFMLQNLAEVFERAGLHKPTRTLLVLIGHGGPDGAPMWSQPTALGPRELRTLHELGGGDDVLVSGNCYGGVLALSTSCGFFGARPDTIASGCQADAAEVAMSKDYLKVFFESLTTRRQHANFDGNEFVSFEEAHWEATLNGDPRNITYSTVDALAEAYFKARPQDLPAELPLSELQRLAQGATAGEKAAVQQLSQGQDGGYRVKLRDLASQAMRWSEKPEGPRPMLGQLARRLLYTQRYGAKDPQLAAAQSCGSRSITGFLKR